MLWRRKLLPGNPFLFFFNVLLQEITHSRFKVCVKDSQGLSNSHDPITVNYVVVGGITFILNIYLVLVCLFVCFYCCCFIVIKKITVWRAALAFDLRIFRGWGEMKRSFLNAHFCDDKSICSYLWKWKHWRTTRWQVLETYSIGRGHQIVIPVTHSVIPVSHSVLRAPINSTG